MVSHRAAESNPTPPRRRQDCGAGGLACHVAHTPRPRAPRQGHNDTVGRNITYREIQDCVRRTFGFTPKTCWIAHVKERNGIAVRRAANRRDPNLRKVPCPPDKREAIERCLGLHAPTQK